MKAKHIAEPWIAKQSDPTEWVVMNGHIVIAIFNRKDNPHWNEANAKRIVACVNACAGINPEAVPDLLEACKKAYAGTDYEAAQKAIARVEGKQ